jgi:hypothetical protein
VVRWLSRRGNTTTTPTPPTNPNPPAQSQPTRWPTTQGHSTTIYPNGHHHHKAPKNHRTKKSPPHPTTPPVCLRRRQSIPLGGAPRGARGCAGGRCVFLFLFLSCRVCVCVRPSVRYPIRGDRSRDFVFFSTFFLCFFSISFSFFIV